MQPQPARSGPLGVLHRGGRWTRVDIELRAVRPVGLGADAIRGKAFPQVGEEAAVFVVVTHVVGRPVEELDAQSRALALDGSGKPERVTPAPASGTHTYNLSPDCRWAFHGESRFDMPGQSDLVRLVLLGPGAWDHLTLR